MKNGRKCKTNGKRKKSGSDDNDNDANGCDDVAGSLVLRDDDGDDREAISGDDCGVFGDDDADEVCDDAGNEGGYEASNEAIDEGRDDEDEGRDDEDDERDGNHDFGVQEEACQDLVVHFGEAARDEAVQSDGESGDDIWNDETIPDPLSEDEEDAENREQEEAENREAENRGNIDPDELLALGKTFDSADDFKLVVFQYSLKMRYDVNLYKSTSMLVGAKCSDTEYGCQWRVYCSYEKSKRKIQIKVYVNEHICVRSGYSKMLKRSTIAWLFGERLRLNPKLTKQEMVAEIKREYNLIVTDEQCGKAKTKLMRERKASHEANFSRIWDYQAEILQSNKGSTMEIETTPGPPIGSKQRFYRLYICFKSQRDAWKNTCRPIIGLDGAFLKWDIKGHLLAAVGRDGDNRIVPIAWAVVEIENDTNWDWFVGLLSANLELGDGCNVSIISDKQKGLVKAVKTVLPQAEHRMCARHIIDNWKKNINDLELKRLFWKIARSYTVGDYEENTAALNRYSPGAWVSLQKTNPQGWSRAYFRVGSCCNDNLNNLNESFNRTIRQARKKPLLDLLEDIRRQCMVRNAKRKILTNRVKTRFTKRAHAEIEHVMKGGTECIRYMSTDTLHEVTHNDVGYRVDFSDHKCGCRKWQMTGIPCIHAACVITAKKYKVDDYVSKFYTTKMWRETYKTGLEPVQGMKLWPRTGRLPVLPPPWRNAPRGRPSNYARRKGINETASSKTKLSRLKKVISCSNCNEEGHNKLRCSNPRVESQPKRPRGQPRLDQGSQGLGQDSQVQGQGSQVQGSQGQGSQVQGSQRQWQGSQVEESQGQGWGRWFM